MNLVGEGLKMERSSKGERKDFGERLKTAISSFTVAFLPHMREEEEVIREVTWEGGERVDHYPVLVYHDVVVILTVCRCFCLCWWSISLSQS